MNIFINQNNWNIPYSSISNSINNPIIQKIKPPISNSFDAHPGIATLVTPQFDELNENIIFPKMPPGVYKFMFFITNSVSNNEMAYVVVTNSTHFVQGECCPQDCELVCSKDFNEYPILESNPTDKELIFAATDRTLFKFTGYKPYNLAHMVANGPNNRALKLPFSCATSRDGNIGSYIIKLRKAIPAGKTVDVKFKATAFVRNITDQNLTSPGYLRIFGLENDINPNDATIAYPVGINTTPYTLNSSGDKAYCIIGGSTSSNGIAIPYTVPFDGIKYSNLCEQVTFADESQVNLPEYSFSWQNNTGKSLQYIMIVPGFSCGNLPALRSLDRTDGPCALTDYLIDDISIKLQPAAAPICIIGDSTEFCTGTSTQTVHYTVCWCAKSGIGPTTFVLNIDDEYAGINVVLPSGNFDEYGRAIVSLTGPGDCQLLTFDVNIEKTISEGVYELPIIFNSSQCSICDAGFYIKSMKPAKITLQECDFTCPCPDGNNIGVKNTTTYWSSLSSHQKNSTCIAVEGNLVIDQNETISGKEFIMQNNSRITIIENEVSFIECTFHGCELLWKGIVVEGNTSVLRVYNCIIRDAREGIEKNNNKALISINFSTMENNYTGIRCNLIPGSSYEVPSIIKSNLFTSTSLLDDPYYQTLGKIGYEGVLVNGANENIGATDAGNIFSSLGSGINIYNAITLIHKNQFNNNFTKDYYNNGSFHSGYGVYSYGKSTCIVGGALGKTTSTNTFYNNYWGIRSYGTLHANNTYMDNVFLGILLSFDYGGSFFINNNNIQLSKYGISLVNYVSGADGVIDNNTFIEDITPFPSPVGYAIGIRLSGKNLNISSYKIHISDNYITGGTYMQDGILGLNMSNIVINNNELNLNTISSTGIRLFGGNDATIKDNNVYEATNQTNSKGFHFYKVNNSLIECNNTYNTDYGFYYAGENTNTNMVTNSMNDHRLKGLLLNRTATLTATTNTNGIHHLFGNLWVGTFPGGTALHEGSKSQIKGSLFETHSDILPIFPIGFMAPNQELNRPWFMAYFPGIDMECQPVLPSGAYTDWLIPYATDSIDFMAYNSSMKQQGELLAYNFMQLNPGLSYATVLQNFYTTYSASSEGQISDIRIRLQKALTFPDSVTNSINALQDSIVNAQDQINTLQVAVGSDPNIAQLITYRSQVTALSQNIATWKVQTDNLRNSYISIRNDTLISLLSDLSFIVDPITNIPLHNALVETHHEIDYILAPGLGLISPALDQVLVIAGECPDYGGPAVFWSRSLISGLYPNYDWDDNMLCQDTLGFTGEHIPIEQRSNNDEAFSSFPNPGSGLIKCSAPNEFAGSIEILDFTGKSLIRKKYITGVNLNMEGYSGVFLIVWRDDSENIIHVNKQIIIK
ncbi:MAG TPA: right-handed parallel beta-helix repeat-containing protein [Saprospiraceae bacterium]|nr:right-handed parallel beta-helix repeat-containing protein [Saprospiraceae bacterium]